MQASNNFVIRASLDLLDVGGRPRSRRESCLDVQISDVIITPSTQTGKAHLTARVGNTTYNRYAWGSSSAPPQHTSPNYECQTLGNRTISHRDLFTYSPSPKLVVIERCLSTAIAQHNSSLLLVVSFPLCCC